MKLKYDKLLSKFDFNCNLCHYIKATFMASYIHTAIIFVILLTFILLVYVSGQEPLGSPGAVYDALQAVSSKLRDCSYTQPGQSCGPVEDNRGGSYLTMISKVARCRLTLL